MLFTIRYSDDETELSYTLTELTMYFYLQYVDREVSVRIGHDMYPFGDLSIEKEDRQAYFEAFMDRIEQIDTVTMTEIRSDELPSEVTVVREN